MARNAIGALAPGRKKRPAALADTGQANAPQGGATALDSRVREQRSLWNNAWRQFRHHKLAMAGLVIFLAFTVIAFVGPLVYNEEVNAPFAYTAGEPPSISHVFGTDSIGQDMLARILYGGRISIAVGLVAALVAISLGTIVGAVAGFFGGFADSLLMRITDLFVSLPQLPLLLLITYLFKESMQNFAERTFGSSNFGVFLLVVLVIGCLAWMPTARLVRASFLTVKEKEFVEAARSIGATRSMLISRHILPNVLSPIIVAATLEVGGAIITESALSFLGLGFPSDVPTWGQMLFQAKDYLELYPHEALIPGTLIFLTVLSINYIGDGLRDALDPRKSQ
jgi:peptide/nickel transport system permease protein